MNFDISRRGKAYLKTAETLLRNARTMSDGTVVAQLEALAENYRRLATKVSYDDAVKAAKALARANAVTAEWNDAYDAADLRHAESFA